MTSFTNGKLKYITGSAAEPKSGDNRVILNIVDKSGNVDDTLFKNLAAKWPKVKESYRGWFRNQVKFNLGEIQIIQTQSDTTIINCLAKKDNKVDTDALFKCLNSVGKEVELTKSNLHMDKIDDDWAKIEEVITTTLLSRGLSLTVYSIISNNK